MSGSQKSAERSFSGKDLQDRLTFLGLDAAAFLALKTIRPIIDREAPRALDKFYARAQATPETRAFFADSAMNHSTNPGSALERSTRSAIVSRKNAARPFSPMR